MFWYSDVSIMKTTVRRNIDCSTARRMARRIFVVCVFRIESLPRHFVGSDRRGPKNGKGKEAGRFIFDRIGKLHSSQGKKFRVT